MEPRPELIPDWETDCVAVVWPTAAMLDYHRNAAALERFYLAFVTELARYERLDHLVVVIPEHESRARLVALTGLPESVFQVAEIPDIWIRDFAPLQTTTGLIKFVYQPPYAPADENRVIDRGIARYFVERGLELRHSPVVLEGGQLVHNGAGLGIATDTIFTRNPGRAPAELVAEIERLLGLDRLVIVPAEPDDRTGHVDGTARFIDQQTLLVNDYRHVPQSDEFVKFVESLERALASLPATIRRVTVPYDLSDGYVDGWYDARGNYSNFLLTRHRAYVPVFGTLADQQAIASFTALFGERVSFIEANAVSTHGGTINCVSWNYRAGLPVEGIDVQTGIPAG